MLVGLERLLLEFSCCSQRDDWRRFDAKVKIEHDIYMKIVQPFMNPLLCCKKAVVLVANSL